MKTSILCFYFIIGIFILIQSCVDHQLSAPGPDSHTDAALYDEMKDNEGYVYYANGSTLSAASASPHGSFKLRFNDIASQALDNSGELPSGQKFPPGSILVKEVYKGSDLYIYAVIKKAPSDASSANGWLWAEYLPDGSLGYSINGKGSSCTSCHSETPNRDLVRTFDLH